MKILIVDDEKRCISVLRSYLREHTKATTIEEATSLETAIHSINTVYPDLVFLDIHLSETESGFDLLDAFPDRLFQVVFTTAYDTYAIKAFDYSVIHYLLKPMDKSEVKLALKRYENNELKIDANKLKEVKFLYLKTENHIFNIELSSVTHLIADGSYCKIYFSDGKSIFSAKNIGEFERRLPENFFRIHKSTIVNINSISQVNSSKNEVILSNNETVSISRRKKTAFLKFLQNNN